MLMKLAFILWPKIGKMEGTHSFLCQVSAFQLIRFIIYLLDLLFIYSLSLSVDLIYFLYFWQEISEERDKACQAEEEAKAQLALQVQQLTEAVQQAKRKAEAQLEALRQSSDEALTEAIRKSEIKFTREKDLMIQKLDNKGKEIGSLNMELHECKNKLKALAEDEGGQSAEKTELETELGNLKEECERVGKEKQALEETVKELQVALGKCKLDVDEASTEKEYLQSTLTEELKKVSALQVCWNYYVLAM